jgi:DNA-binding NarL/FixJ family response regulator
MSGKRKKKRQESDPSLDELRTIKKLLVLQLMMSGVQTTDIAAALGVNKGTISKLVPLRKVKRSKKK